jgi:2Fe-2S ferredoxin
MTRITILPHAELCPKGAIIEAAEGLSLCEALLHHGIEIEHACEMSCACTTCHVILREGYASLAPADELEEDMLDKAWGLTTQSRLACQAIIGPQPLTIELPKYSINQIREARK